MGFSEERQNCYDWFTKEYAGKIGIVAFEAAFKEVALKAWCARAAKAKESTEKADNSASSVNRCTP